MKDLSSLSNKTFRIIRMFQILYYLFLQRNYTHRLFLQISYPHQIFRLFITPSNSQSILGHSIDFIHLQHSHILSHSQSFLGSRSITAFSHSQNYQSFLRSRSFTTFSSLLFILGHSQNSQYLQSFLGSRSFLHCQSFSTFS